MKRILACFLMATVALTLQSVPGHAQGMGSVSGVVSGPNGPLSNLVVNLVNIDTGAVVGTARTSSTGAYSVANLPPGNYTTQVLNATGTVLSTRNVLVAAGVATTVNMALTASQLAAAGIAAGGAAAAGGLSTGAILGIAGATAAGIGTAVALKDDASPSS